MQTIGRGRVIRVLMRRRARRSTSEVGQDDQDGFCLYNSDSSDGNDGMAQAGNAPHTR